MLLCYFVPRRSGDGENITFVPRDFRRTNRCAISKRFIPPAPPQNVDGGHVVRVVTLNRRFDAPPGEGLVARETMAGIEVVRVPYFGSRRYPVAGSVIKHIKDADIVHVHGLDFFFDYLALTALWHRRKLVV